VAIALQLMTKLVLIAHLPAAIGVWVLTIVPAWARWGTLVWGAMLPPLKQGLGQEFASSIPKAGIAVWALVLAAASFLVAPALLAALILVPAVGFYWRRRLGGITGDCLGASLEVTETLLLVTAVFVPYRFWNVLTG
jgi:adenosylcobinamide-GDP ribazoletransferase